MTTEQCIAIVTGGGTGIGRATCIRLAKDGYTVIVVYAKSESGAQQTQSIIQNDGGSADIFKADISIEQDVIDLFSYTLKNYSRVDVVINNAGIGRMVSFKDITSKQYNKVFDTNTRGTFHMCREAARHINDNGRIINISTGITVSSQAGMTLYSASKAAIEAFSKTLAHELGPRGITVNSVSPGMTDTPMLEGGDTEALKKYGIANSVLKRLGQPEDIADVIASLVSNDGRWITGQNIHADGGIVII